jgi:hypothetical protein
VSSIIVKSLQRSSSFQPRKISRKSKQVVQPRIPYRSMTANRVCSLKSNVTQHCVLAPKPDIPKASASSLRNKFEQLAMEQKVTNSIDS